MISLLKKMRPCLIYDSIITIVLWLSIFLLGEVFTEGVGAIAIWAAFIAIPIRFLENYIIGPLFAVWFQKYDFTGKEILLSALIMFGLSLLVPVVTVQSSLCRSVVYCVVYVIFQKTQM